MERKTGVLFDLDGVLVDSEGEYTKFWGVLWDVATTSAAKLSHTI